MCAAGIFTEVTHDTHLLLLFPWGGLLFTKQYFPIYPYSFRNKPDQKQGLGSAPIISCCLCITVWLLTCLSCLEWVFKSLLLMLASLLPLLEPGKLLAFHLESEGGITASHLPYCAGEEGSLGTVEKESKIKGEG